MGSDHSHFIRSLFIYVHSSNHLRVSLSACIARVVALLLLSVSLHIDFCVVACSVPPCRYIYSPGWSAAEVVKIPQWLWLLSGWNIWVYQFLDAIDGKQARRLRVSSPVGQLLDHGCDACACWMMMSGIMTMLGFGASPFGMTTIALVMCAFFAALWEE